MKGIWRQWKLIKTYYMSYLILKRFHQWHVAWCSSERVYNNGGTHTKPFPLPHSIRFLQLAPRISLHLNYPTGTPNTLEVDLPWHMCTSAYQDKKVYQTLWQCAQNLKLQTELPADAIACRIRVKRVEREDETRKSRRSRSCVQERQGRNRSSAPRRLSLLAAHGYDV